MEAMTLEDWKGLKVLKRDGAWYHWGEPERIAKPLVLLLDQFCFEKKLEPMITYGTQGKHLQDSQHYASDVEPGKAVDVMFPRLSLLQMPDVYFMALHYPFHGLGLYNGWKLSAEGRPIGGMHFDVRDTPEIAHWIGERVGHEDRYIGLTFANLKECFK